MKNNIQKGTRSPPHYFRGAVAWLLLVCFIPLAAVPARADSTNADNRWLQVLDYGTLYRNDDGYVSGNRTNVATSDKFFYDLPEAMTVNYVDLLFVAPKITGISVGYGSFGFKSLTLTNISGNLWRAYGAVEEHTYATLEIRVTNSAASYITVNSFRVLNVYSVSDIGTYRWEHTNGGTTNSGSANTSGLPKTWTIPWYSESTEFILTIPNAAARKYDYIDVSFACTWYSVSAISVTSNRMYIPYEYDYIESGGGADKYNWLCTTIRIDLTGFISESTDVFVRIEGIMQEDSQFSLQGIKGMVNIRYLDPELYWYQQIFQALTNPDSDSVLAQIRSALEAMAGVIGNIYVYLLQDLTDLLNTLNLSVTSGFSQLNSVVSLFKTSVESKFDELISILSPDTSEADQTADELAQRGEEIGGLNDQINQVQKPDINSIDVDIWSVNTGSDFALASSMFGVLFNSDILMNIIMMSLMFMLASYVLFGKR